MSGSMFLMLSVLTIAHRGASGEAPENTLAAFQRAVELRSDWIELDVHYARDGSIAVIHDATVDRTTGAKGAVSEMTRMELAGLDAGSWFSPGFAGQRLPMLEEVLEALQGHSVGILIEVKKGNGLPDDFAERLLEAVGRYGLRDRVIVQSFDHDAVRRLKQVDPGLTTAALIGSVTPDPVGEAVAAQSEILAIKYTILNPTIVTQAHERGLKVFVWTVDNPRDIQTMLQWGVDGIISNYPDRVLELAGKARP